MEGIRQPTTDLNTPPMQPTVHLVFDTYADSFDAVWGTSTPATIDQAEAG